MSACFLGVALDQVVRGGRGSPVAGLEGKEFDADSAGAAVSAGWAWQALADVLGSVLWRLQDSELVPAARAVEVRRGREESVDGSFNAEGVLVRVTLVAGFVGG